jgi:hypothetical protein
MTAKNCLQILMDNDAPGSAVGTPAPSRQPDDALDPELIDELDLKPGEAPAGVSKRTSKPAGREGRCSRTRSRTTH